MIDYDMLINQLKRETINLSDDGKIEDHPVFKKLAKAGMDARPALWQSYGHYPSRAVLLLLNRLKGK